MFKQLSKKKRILLIIGASVAALTVITVVLFAVVRYNSMRGTCGDNLTWVYDGKGTLTISGTGNMENYEVIPSNRPEWEQFRNEITTVEIEYGVTSIGEYAFSTQAGAHQIGYNDSLTDVDIPESITNIGAGAFYGCNSLKDIAIPASVSQMGRSVFYYCSDLTTVILKGRITSIEGTTFIGCSSLTSIILPNTITSIGTSAFRDCTNLTSITIPEDVTVIEMGAFANCSSLNDIVFQGDAPILKYPDSITSNWIFDGVTANAYYPPNNKTWDGYKAGYLGGDITWIALP